MSLPSRDIYRHTLSDLQQRVLAPPKTLEEFHAALCADLGRPREKFQTRRVGKLLLSVPSGAHRTPWAETTFNIQARKLLVNLFLNFQQNALSRSDYEKLRQLASVGISKYWSGGVTIGTVQFSVTVTAHHRKKPSIQVDLALSNEKKYKRSHNVGILAIDASFIYNRGYFGSAHYADLDFMLTCAHEFGHSVLMDFGGLQLSWGHKGSTNPVLQAVKSSTPSYPDEGPIDLMKYYKTDPAHFIGTEGLAKRSCADELDLKRLLWLSKWVA